MHPILFKIPLPGDFGPLPIYSYGVMLGLSLVVGWYLTLGLAERDGLPKETMANCYVVTALAAVVGSRVLYILTNLNEFETFSSMFAMRRGGLVAYGGFLGGFVGSYVFLRRHRIALMPWADVAVPSLASGLMITRVGCYLFGCDFGRPLQATAPAWLQKLGTFPKWPEGTLEHGSGSPAWVHHVQQGLITQSAEASLPVHPTQIYESLVGVGLLALLLVARRHQKFRGQIFFLFTFAYGVCRYLLEILRDDAERGSIPPSLPQHVLVPLGLVVFAVGYVVGFSKGIKNLPVRRVTQALAFVPAVVAYVMMKPETYGLAPTYQYSTSQAVALSTALAVSVAFAIFYKAALAHPESAMALNLPGAATAGPAPGRAADEDDEAEGEDEAPKSAKLKAAQAKAVKPKVAAKKTAKAGAKKKAEAEPKPREDGEAADDAAADEDGQEETAKDDAGEAEKPRDEGEDEEK